MRATCWLRSVTMRTFSTVGRPASSTSPTVEMPAAASESAQPLRGRVDADHADERHAGAERREIVRDVRRAAEPDVFVLEPHHGHRRFRRDPRHLADDEPIEHDVADDEDAESRQPRHEIAAAPRVERRQRHAWASAEVQGRAAANGSVTSEQEQHQELGVAEVVLEHARPPASRPSRRARRRRASGRCAGGTRERDR